MALEGGIDEAVSPTGVDASEVIAELSVCAREQGDLRLLLLYGSRARGEAGEHSDWDVAYLADADFDPLAFLARLTATLGTECVDLVDLDQASGLLRFRAARDGIAIFERDRGAFSAFRLEAVHAWCDLEPVVRRAHRDVLAGLAG